MPAVAHTGVRSSPGNTQGGHEGVRSCPACRHKSLCIGRGQGWYIETYRHERPTHTGLGSPFLSASFRTSSNMYARTCGSTRHIRTASAPYKHRFNTVSTPCKHRVSTRTVPRAVHPLSTSAARTVPPRAPYRQQRSALAQCHVADQLERARFRTAGGTAPGHATIPSPQTPIRSASPHWARPPGSSTVR